MPMQTVQSQMAVQILWQECPVRARQRRLRFRWRWGCRQCAHQSPLNVQDLVNLISWDISEVFSCRASVMRTVPRFLWGSFRVALKVALEEIRVGHSTRNTQRLERGWKLFLFLPRMVLHRSPRGGPISRDKLIGRFDQFAAGHWRDMIDVTSARRRLRQLSDVDNEDRPTQVHTAHGGLRNSSSLGNCLLAVRLWKELNWHLGIRNTLDQLRQRLDVPREPNPELPRDTPLFNFGEKMFSRNVRSAKKGAAAGPSGMTCDHLQPLLDSNPDMHLLFVVGELFSRGQIPHDIVQLVKLGRMTALRKKDGGVRGIVAGEVIRRLVARTIAQQLNSAAAAATAPFQYALTTRAGCECVSHALQAICELDENATVTSIDGVSACDTISRRAMLLERVLGGGAASPFLRLFYSEPSAYIWEDDDGVVHTIRQGKAVSRETPSCHSYSASDSTQHWKRFNRGCVRVNDFSRTWMTCVWCHSRTGHGTHTMWRSKSCGHTPRSASMQARPTCGTRRGAMSCSGERCCTIRQHRSGGGPLSPRGSR